MVRKAYPRRNFLADGMCLLGVSLLNSLSFSPPRLISTQDGTRKTVTSGDTGGMIVYSEEYITREMPVSFLHDWITPVQHFFVRNNELMPGLDVANWRLSIVGEVAHPLELTLQELGRYEPGRVTNTLECAGNGRAFFSPRVTGVPWSRGGVGNGTFSGPPLAKLLEAAGLKRTARHVAFRGVAVPSPSPPFIRSIPIAKALDPETLIATEMNDAPLTPEHGYPLRALVPGWIGSASIKWLTEIRVMTEEFHGFFMDSAYRLPGDTLTPDNPNAKVPTRTITSLAVKSIISFPTDGSVIDASTTPVRIRGAAWAGESDIARVEVSTDGGRSWRSADLSLEHARFSWRLWSFAWTPPGDGEYDLLSRATDRSGRSQPMQMRWNPGGYLWNAVDRIHVIVRGTRAA
jgi:sulfite oxidase